MNTKVMGAAVAAALVTLSLSADVVRDGKNITVTGKGSVPVDEAELQVAVESGATAEIQAGGNPVTVHSDGGAVVLDGGTWTNKVVFWLDAAAPESLRYEYVNDDPTQAQTKTTVGGKAYPNINRWYDRRGRDQKYYGLETRGLAYASDKTFPSVMPYVATNEVTGLPYISFGTYGQYARRMSFYATDDGKDDTDTTKQAVFVNYKFAAIVFGSQQGGGQTLIYNLARGGITDCTTVLTEDAPIFDAVRPTWVDGESVDPTVTGFNGDWQVVSYSLLTSVGYGVRGLCNDRGNSWMGGGNYCEIILLESDPTVAERQAIERYLAQKWGTAAPKHEALDNEVRLFGTGSATVSAGAFKLGGEFEGTVSVAADAALTLTDTALAPTNPAPFATGETRDLWYDSERIDSIQLYGDAAAHRVGFLYNLLAPQPFSRLEPDVMYGSSRTPTYYEEARGFGPVRRWLVHHVVDGSVGCTLRLEGKDSMDGKTFGFKTGFMVLDTSLGGGTPFLANNLSGDGKYINTRSYASNPVFSVNAGSHDFVKNATACLNGISIEPTARAYNGRPEVLSCSFSEEFPLRCIGFYSNTSDSFRLIHGESIFYARTLTAAEYRDTEAYLMKKWLGITPAGYGDPSAMTIAGAGSVTLAARAERPAFATDFTGTVNVPGTLEVGFAEIGGVLQVKSPVLVPNGSVVLPDKLVVKLDLDGLRRVKGGTYALIDAAAWTGGTTIELDTGNLGRWSGQYELVRTGNRLDLVCTDPGLMLILR